MIMFDRKGLSWSALAVGHGAVVPVNLIGQFAVAGVVQFAQLNLHCTGADNKVHRSLKTGTIPSY